MKFIHKLWIKLNDVNEYDVQYGSWKIYQKMYKNNLVFSEKDIIRNDGRPYIKCQFKNKQKSTKTMKFSGETDFNFSNNKKWELHRSRYEHYKKILERDLIDTGILNFYIEMLNKCTKMHHSQDNISLMPQSGNMQGTKGNIGLDRLDVWLLVLDMKYRLHINLLQNHCTIENCSEIEEFLNLFDDVYDYANTIYHIDRELVDKLIDLGKRPLNTADNVIRYMTLANEFWKQKHNYIKEQLNKE